MERESQNQDFSKREADRNKGTSGMADRMGSEKKESTSGKKELEKVIDYEAIDHYDNSVGKVTALWANRSDEPAYVGIETGKFFGKTHIVPALGVETNHKRKSLRVPYTTKEIEDAPSFDPESELTPQVDREVRTYFRALGEVIPEEGEKGGEDKKRKGSKKGDGKDKSFMGGKASSKQTTGRESSSEDTTIPLHEEELKVGKRQSDIGGVRLRKVVRDEEVQKPVRVRREDVEIERVSVDQASGDRKAGTRGDAFQDGEDIFIPLKSEEPEITKESRVREEVRAHKTSQDEERKVSGTVRKEDVEIKEEKNRGRGKRSGDDDKHYH